MRIPPNVTAADYAKALAEFERIVGKEWVFTSDEDLDMYRDAFSPLRGQPGELFAAGAVAPNATEQVQQIVRVANTYRIPLYTISTGRNLGYGGSAPTYSGSVVLDLKRMNRILEVNEKNAYALVEPGVSYFDLYHYLQEHKIRLIVDTPDPGWGSVLGNAMDRGGGYTTPNHRNHFDSHCGMEVVLPNGELLRTGMGAMPNSETWQQYKTGCGPWIDGIFSQSNFGIVTKMGIWMMPEPEAYQRCTVAVPRYQDLSPLIEILNYLENSRIFGGYLDLGSPLLGTVPLTNLYHFFEDGPPPLEPAHGQLLADAKLGYSPELEAYGIAKGIPYWEAWLSFYGPPEVIEAQWRAVQRHFAPIDGAKFRVVDQAKFPIDPATVSKYRETELGVPTLRLFSQGTRRPFNPQPWRGHLAFSPIIPRTGAAIFEANRVFGEAAREMNMPLFHSFALPTPIWERSFVFIMGAPVMDDPASNQRLIEGFNKLIQVGAQHGWGEYRTAPVFQKAVMETYSFNNHSLLRFHELLKDAIDPNGILSPGRYNIWPKHLRGPLR